MAKNLALVIEDDVDLSEIFSRALQEAGFSDCSEQESFNGLLRDYRAVRASTVQ